MGPTNCVVMNCLRVALMCIRNMLQAVRGHWCAWVCGCLEAEAGSMGSSAGSAVALTTRLQ